MMLLMQQMDANVCSYMYHKSKLQTTRATSTQT